MPSSPGASTAGPARIFIHRPIQLPNQIIDLINLPNLTILPGLTI